MSIIDTLLIYYTVWKFVKELHCLKLNAEFCRTENEEMIVALNAIYAIA